MVELERHVRIPVDSQLLAGDLRLPHPHRGVVLFAHGSGSGRLSPRNRFVAEHLNQSGFGTLLLDLLTEEEERADAVSGHLRFDIGMLADRLVGSIDWLMTDGDTQGTPIGLFGASTGAAAAIVAATRKPNAVKAIVSRGGRPDLAGAALRHCAPPILLLVGSLDAAVIPLNQAALGELGSSTKELRIVEGAGHLFGEPGTLQTVAEEASDWFASYL